MKTEHLSASSANSPNRRPERETHTEQGLPAPSPCPIHTFLPVPKTDRRRRSAQLSCPKHQQTVMPHHHSPAQLEGSLCALTLFVTRGLAAVAAALTVPIRPTPMTGATQRSHHPTSVRLGNTNMHYIPISASGLPRCTFHEHTRPGGLYSSHLIFTFLNTVTSHRHEFIAHVVKPLFVVKQ